MDYFNYDSKIKPSKGKLLISEPFMNDTNFERSVVLLCEHNEEGSFGFILNNPTQATLQDVMTRREEEVAPIDAPLFLGGPVEQNTLHFVHKYENIQGAIPITRGVYWGGEFEEIMEPANGKEFNKKDFKFFLGYSGWGENQLNEEIDAGSWIVSDHVDPILIFHTHPEDMWKVVLKSLGGRFNIYSNYPVDPRYN